MSEFIDWMQKNETLKPTNITFNYDEWLSEAISRMNNDSNEDHNLLEATKYTYEIIITNRETMEYLLEKITKYIDYDSLIEKAVSNANLMFITEIEKQKNNLMSKQNNDYDNLCINLTSRLDNLIESTKSILDCISFNRDTKRDSKTQPPSLLKKLLNLIDSELDSEDEIFQKMHYFASNYHLHSFLYQKVLYGSMDFIAIDEISSNIKFIFEEKKSNRNFSFRELTLEINDNHLQNIQNRNEYLQKIINANYKKGNALALQLHNPSRNIKNIFFTYKQRFTSYLSMFSSEVFSHFKSKTTFTIEELVTIYIHLIILSRSIHMNIKNKKFIIKKSEINLSIDQLDLIEKLSIVTSYDKVTVQKTLNFLTYHFKKDIFSAPIIKIDKSFFTLLLGALVSPYHVKAINSWLSYLSIPMNSKGYGFENRVYSKLIELVCNNPVINQSKIFKSIKIKHNGKKIELDLAIIINKSIYIIESKSIPHPDSEVSLNNCYKEIEHGTEQIKEIQNAFNKNPILLKKMGILSDYNEYKFFPFILVENGFMSGYSVNGINVIKEINLYDFFSKNFFPVYINSNTPIAHLTLYNSIETAEKNLNIFLKNPIQKYLFDADYEHVSMHEFFSNVRYLVKKPIDINTLVQKLFLYKALPLKLNLDM